MLKIGIIGAGRMGNSHAAILEKNKSVQLSTVYDVNPEQSAKFVEKHPNVKIMASLQELVNSPETDFIVITTPTYCHKEGLLAAMTTGKPIFCEKPLCRTREDLDELTPLLQSYGNFFAIGFVRRYSPVNSIMKKLIDEGKLGRLRSASVVCRIGTFQRQWGDWFADYDKSGGVMLDMLAHHCDLLNYIVGSPVSVYAQAFRLPKDQPLPSDYASATAVLQNNVICNVECYWLRGGPTDVYMTVYGEKGALKQTDTGVFFYDIGGKETKHEGTSAQMFEAEWENVVDCAINGKKPLAGAQDAVNAMEFCLGMMESAETGNVVKF
ncbi:MAG: Gfo/Idh/MocA family oxidoreductase [Victivallales bacterium]|nr:Gfo/Idh/MocA family oxidoreductase [Victivallales bacterium]